MQSYGLSPLYTEDRGDLTTKYTYNPMSTAVLPAADFKYPRFPMRVQFS
jgi:hypothetical protein